MRHAASACLTTPKGLRTYGISAIFAIFEWPPHMLASWIFLTFMPSIWVAPPSEGMCSVSQQKNLLYYFYATYKSLVQLAISNPVQINFIYQSLWHPYSVTDMLNIMGSRSRNDVGAFGKIVAEILNDARLNHNVSQLQLQESTGISQSQLSKQLRGIRAINLDELEAICATLSISVKEVLILAEAKLDATRKT